MRFLSVIFCLYLAASLCEGAVVQKRIYRNTEEILVPVTVIQDGDQIKDPVKSVETEAIAEQIANLVDEEQKLETSEVVAEAQRRFDEAIVEEEIKEVVAEENKELLNAVAEEEKIEKEIIKHDLLEEKKEEELKSLSAIKQAVVKPEAIKAVEVLPVNQQEAEKPLQQIKSVLVEKETPEKVVVVVETAEEDEPEGAGRQATQATPAQTTQQNFVQQFIQNSPLGQFFNQITGQNTPAPVANDEGDPATPAPTNPGFLNPVAAFTNAAQSAVNSTQQALQQFASNIGNQFQNTLSSLTGQPQQQQQLGTNDATTARPGPILQLVNTFMGNNNPQSAQPAPGQQQGPLQGLLNIFQGNNRPQSPAAAPTTTIKPQPGKQPEITEQTNDAAEEVAADEINNEIRSSGEVADSFEDTVQPEELIVVNDDASQTHDVTNDEQESANVSK